MPNPIFVKDRQHQYVYFNDAFRVFTGSSQEVFRTQSVYHFVQKNLQDQDWQEDELIFTTGKRSERKRQLIDSKGNIWDALTQKYLFHDEANNPFLVTAIYLETPDRASLLKDEGGDGKQNELRLQKSLIANRALLEAIPDLLIRMQRDGTYLDLALEGNFKPSAIQAICGKNIRDVMPPEIVQKRLDCIQRALETRELQIHEQELIINDRAIYEEVRIVPCGEDEVLTIIRDITAQKQAEIALQKLNEQLEHKVEERTLQLQQAIDLLEQEIRERKRTESLLQEQEQFLRSIYEGIEKQIFVVNVLEHETFQYGGWNKFTEQKLAISSKQAIGKTPEDIFGPIEGKKVRERFASCLQMGVTVVYEECLTFLGQELWFITTLNPLKDAGGKIYRIVGSVFEITDRKQAEIALQHSEAQFRQQTQVLEQTIRELQQAQMQLVQSEKMSSLGQLVAGIAHEINNPINFIYGNLKHADLYGQDLLELISLYRKYYPDSKPEICEKSKDIDLDFLVEDFPDLLNSMKLGVDRIRNIISALRTFSRMDESEMKAVNIAECIDSTLVILQHRLKALSDRPKIEVIKSYSDLPLVECLAGQLNQVFMNILSNAIDAVEEISFSQAGYTPTITIKTGINENHQVSIQISDNGPGMPEKDKNKIFDLFFTTKPIGKGTGMGLSISYQIIAEKHGGRLWCDSTPGQGTRFVIEIPIQQKK